MKDFSFVAPTKLFFGKKAEDRLGEALKEFHVFSLLLVYGGGSIKRSGLYDKVISTLQKNNIAYSELSGIRANPTKQRVEEGVKEVKAKKLEWVLAVGGGSVIDTAKAIAVGAYYDGDPFDFNLKKAIPQRALPVGVVLTIASAGSEMSDSCVISDDATGIKQGFNSDLVRPKFALEDPEITYTVPPFQTAAGFCDIMMHSLERYFEESGDLQLSDEWALDLVKNVMEAGTRVLKDPCDYDARAALMLASSLSHNGLTGIGKQGKFVVHPLEHALSGYRPDITHGTGVALLYPAWAQHVYPLEQHKFAVLAHRLFNISNDDERKAAIMGIAAMKEFFHAVGMPTSFGEVGITAQDIPSLVRLATGNGTRVVGCYPQPLNEQDVKEIYESLL